MKIDKQEFSEAVYKLVSSIPKGRVMTYGQIASLLGYPRAAQYVGWTLHWAPPTVPFQRVVNRFGGLAGGYTRGGRLGHKSDLEKLEGIVVRPDLTVNLENYLWHPNANQVPKLKNPEILEASSFSSRHR